MDVTQNSHGEMIKSFRLNTPFLAFESQLTSTNQIS